VFKIFRSFSDYDKKIKYPNYCSDKAERTLSVPQIIEETVTGFGFRDEIQSSSPREE